MVDYIPKTEPYTHQKKAFDASCDAKVFGLFCEQRTGKTKIVIDTAAYLFENRSIDALLIVAMPGRVHRNWVALEIPAHLPDRVPRACTVWDSRRASSASFQGELDLLLETPSLAVLAVNGEAIITVAFRKFITRFLRRRRALVVADEFSLIMKTPGTQRTKMMHAIGRQPNAAVRRILDGTPSGEGPLDLYAPLMFLDWRILGFTSFVAFRNHFAKWETGKVFDPRTGTTRDYPKLVGYQNLDELQAKLAPHSFRVLRKDCWDVPEKVYQIHPFQLSPEQRRVYDSLESEYEADLPTGQRVSATHVLTRYLRLQQVASNYWPSETVGTVHAACGGNGCTECDDLGVIIGKTLLRPIAATNPRIAAAREIFEMNAGRSGIVWARFHEDVDQVLELARLMAIPACRYDGRCSPEEKDESQDHFQLGRSQLLVGNPRSGGRGLKLSRASFILNYSNEFSLLTRLQSEDRAEEKGKLEGTGIIDLVAENTLDDLVIIPALRAKKKITDYVMNERGGRWL